MSDRKKELASARAKLKYRNKELYLKYFYNPPSVINEIVESINNEQPIDESKCEHIFNISYDYKDKLYDLITFYPNNLKKHRIVTNQIIDDMLSIYGETIRLMKENKHHKPKKTIRNKIKERAARRAREKNMEINIDAEDILLVEKCPLLNIKLEYCSPKITKYSPSIDRIDNSKGYVKGNVQIISFLANKIKGTASINELVTFSENILKIHKKKNNNLIKIIKNKLMS